MSYPGEAIRAVITTADDKTNFFRLASGKTGLLHQKGKHSIARLVEPGSILVDIVDDSPSLMIDFREIGFPPGIYPFTTQEDAAEVSLWLMGTMSMATPSSAETDGDQTTNASSQADERED